MSRADDMYMACKSCGASIGSAGKQKQKKCPLCGGEMRPETEQEKKDARRYL